MVTHNPKQLKSDAFKLSKILAAYKIKLSSQQALDSLSRLYWNVPYEALIATEGTAVTPPSRDSSTSSTTLSDWLAIGSSFCDVLRTLDREGVNQAAWNGHKVPADGLHWDARRYLRAAGVAADMFSRFARDFVNNQPHIGDLTFIVEAGNPIVTGEIAIMRIQYHKPGTSAPRGFVGLGMDQDTCEDILYGAEARIELLTVRPDHDSRELPFDLTPLLRLTYRVSGQHALKAFGSVLKDKVLQPVWRDLGHLNVHTDILLTTDNSQDSIEEDWQTDEDPDAQRLQSFCDKASKLSDDETCDWPPFVELSHEFNSTSTEDDLRMFVINFCVHAMCLYGGGDGWHELTKQLRARAM